MATGSLAVQASNLQTQPLPAAPGRSQQSSLDEQQLARANWERFNYMKDRGHVQWCERAKRLEELYMGGGRQWLPQDREYMEEETGRKCVEINEIADAVNNALGYQINNRVDIAFKPRGQGASDDIATTLSKVAMQIADNTKFQWHESQVFADGLIQQRGYFEMRMVFDDSMQGEIGLFSLDPLDVIPDPDSKSYDPDEWQDVVITRWMTLDDVEGFYGTAARKKIEARGQFVLSDRDFGFDLNEVERNKFGTDDWNYDRQYDAYFEEAGVVRVRVVDRQYWKLVNTRVVVFPTGDIRVAATATPAKIAYWRSQGCIIMNRPVKRVRWTVSASTDTLLHDDWSPYNHFTVIPYFPFFRRGHTKGFVDDLEGPQELLNKSLTTYLHIVGTTANSGWIVEENSLTEISTEDLKTEGHKTGLVLEFRKNSTPPKKIEANSVPTGIDRLVSMGSEKIRSVSGQTDPMRGVGGANQSGVAIQSQQFAAQMSLAVPLDNLTRTRHMVAQRMLELIQQFYDEERVWRITQPSKNGTPITADLITNQRQTDGTVLNDLTVGEYDAVITEQPQQITFENSQFNQALAMRKQGINVPDDVVIRYSSLADKADIIDRMQQQAGQANPVDEAKAALAQAQSSLASAKAVAANVEALFSAIRTGQIIAAMPQVAPIADTIVKSAGFHDQDAAPIYGEPGAVAGAAATGTPMPPNNTDPATPDHADRGMNTGIEAGPQAAS